MRDNSLYVTPTPFPPSPHRQGEFADPVSTPPIFEDYWVILRRYRWTVLITLCVCVFLAIFSLTKSEPVYTATAIIRIQGQAPNITGVADTFKTEGSLGEDIDYFRRKINLLKSRNIAARVIKDLR